MINFISSLIDFLWRGSRLFSPHSKVLLSSCQAAQKSICSMMTSGVGFQYLSLFFSAALAVSCLILVPRSLLRGVVSLNWRDPSVEIIERLKVVASSLDGGEENHCDGGSERRGSGEIIMTMIIPLGLAGAGWGNWGRDILLPRAQKEVEWRQTSLLKAHG